MTDQNSRVLRSQQISRRLRRRTLRAGSPPGMRKLLNHLPT